MRREILFSQGPSGAATLQLAPVTKAIKLCALTTTFSNGTGLRVRLVLQIVPRTMDTPYTIPVGVCPDGQATFITAFIGAPLTERIVNNGTVTAVVTDYTAAQALCSPLPDLWFSTDITITITTEAGSPANSDFTAVRVQVEDG